MANCQAWAKYAELEAILGETERKKRPPHRRQHTFNCWDGFLRLCNRHRHIRTTCPRFSFFAPLPPPGIICPTLMQSPYVLIIAGARAIYELAVGQPLLDMPEVLWKAFIDFETELGECVVVAATPYLLSSIVVPSS